MIIANKELAFQNKEKGKRAAELIVANKELTFQNIEKEKRAAELIIANKELAFQNKEKGKRAAELIIANKELTFQNIEKEKRAAELIHVNKELASQNKEKEIQAAELIIVNTALNKSEANLRTVFDNTTTVYILVDSDLKIVSFNKGGLDGLSKELGKTLQIGKNVLDFIDDDKKQRTAEMYRRVFDGEQFKLEEHYTPKGKETIWYDMQLLPVYKEEGKVLNMIIYLSDITQRKIAEIEKERISANLLHRNKDLEQFSYIISHNLRLPVANIIGLVENLVLNNFDASEKKEAFTAIHISARRLDDVVMDLNKILDVRTKENENKQLLKLSDILYDAKINLGFIIKKESGIIESDFGETDALFTIKSYISSIFYNLILNSIKYRHPPLTPYIKISSRKVNNKLVLTFSDNGLGIDLAKTKGELFGLYKRFHPHVNGKGVGLYMVRLQVEALGGTISVASKVNDGTVFTIEFEA